MLVVISPAKRLDWAQQDVAMTQPAFQDDAARLVKTARNLTLGNLKGLMSLSDDLARLNRDRFAAFETAPQADSTRPAALAFAGDTYQGLQAASLDHDDMIWAQEHLRILSGLYGLLRPLDAIQPYRLEMGSRLKTRRGANLYEYWRDGLSKALNSQAEKLCADLLVNCASQEYFGAVAPKALKLKVVTPVFLEEKDDGKGPRVVSFFAKKARGAMARYIIQNRCVSQLDLQGFQHGGYIFKENMSSEGKPVFVRPYPTA